MNIPTLSRSRFVSIMSMLCAVSMVGVFLIFSGSASSGGNDHIKQTPTAYKQSLKDQVDTANGEPRSGRDPAGQQQTSLAMAASSEHGSGMQTDTPAAGLKGSNRGAVSPSQVYGDPSKTRINDSGCYIDYGIQGQECLPVSIAMDGMVMCSDVRTEFPKGLKVVGKDWLGLDTNHDGIACGPND